MAPSAATNRNGRVSLMHNLPVLKLMRLVSTPTLMIVSSEQFYAKRSLGFHSTIGRSGLQIEQFPELLALEKRIRLSLAVDTGPLRIQPLTIEYKGMGSHEEVSWLGQERHRILHQSWI